MSGTSAQERAFRSLASEIGEARSFVLSHDHVGDAGADVLALVTSELASNAVLHARTPFVVRVEQVGAGVRVAVFDHSPRVPVPRPPEPGSVTGRGLAIVTALAGSWGVDVVEDGKWVWAVVGGERAD